MWVAATVVAAMGCNVVTSPDGGAGDVIVGNNFYKSARNGSQNPAVDTVARGATVVRTWGSDGSHLIQSTGMVPAIFRNSVVFSTANSTYTVTFKNPGTYTYDCGAHGSAMTGVIVVH